MNNGQVSNPERHDMVQALQALRGRAVRLHTLSQPEQNGIGYLDRIVRMLSERCSQVGRLGLVLGQDCDPRIPRAPAVQSNQNTASKHDSSKHTGIKRGSTNPETLKHCSFCLPRATKLPER